MKSSADSAALHRDSRTHTPGSPSPPPDLSEENIRAQVNRITSSATFAAAETQKRLLLYLADRSLQPQSSWLKEYTVGVEALGKPASYDPQKDSIVRIQASRLRQRLVSYYREEGLRDPIVVDLPKGQFKLTFAAAASPLAPALPEIPPPEPNRNTVWRRIALSLAAALVVTLAWAAIATRSALSRADFSAPTAQQTWSPGMAALWAPFLEGSRVQNQRPLLVSTGAAMFLRVQDIGFVRIPEVNTWTDVEDSNTVARLTANFRKRATPWTNFTLLGESAAAFHVGRVLGMRKRDVIFTNTTTLSWAEITQHDMVFIGPPKFIPHVKEMPGQQLVLESEGVRDLNPGPGQPEWYRDRALPSGPSDGVSHALISRLSGVGGHDAEVLSIGGNWGPDTLAGVRYLTEPRLAAELAERIRSQDGRLPRHYQVIIRVEFRNMTPLRTAIVTHRIYTN